MRQSPALLCKNSLSSLARSSERRVPITEKELGKGSTEYAFSYPLSTAALDFVDKTEL